MDPEIELAGIADSMRELLPKFFDTQFEGLALKSDDQATFKRLSIEAKTIMDAALGRLNDFSMNLNMTVVLSSGGMIGGPSYAAVEECIAIVHGAINQIRRAKAAPVLPSISEALKPAYVSATRIFELQGLPTKTWNYSRLIKMCGELNLAHSHQAHLSVIMLVRAIIDHIPPLFGEKVFSAVADNHGTQSTKASLKRLGDSSRNIADQVLHTQIRKHEIMPTEVQVNFSNDLDVLLGEVVRRGRVDNGLSG